MHVASLELCKELYELSRWETPQTWAAYSSYDDTEQLLIVDSEAGELGHDIYRVAYAYDLGYLLRKLPTTTGSNYLLLEVSGDNWNIGYAEYGEVRGQSGSDNTPENAACKLAIELFKQGILT